MRYKDFETKWLKAFAKDLTKEQLTGRITSRGQYLWHAFSFEMIPCLEGDAANAEYNKVNKEGATEFSEVYPHWKTIPDPLPLAEMHMKAEQIEDKGLSEFYVIGMYFSWCYIRTHEEGYGLGPYFIYASKEETEDALRCHKVRKNEPSHERPGVHPSVSDTTFIPYFFMMSSVSLL